MDIEFIILNYLGYNSGRNPFSFTFCTFAVFIWGLPALIVCLAGTVEAGWSLISSGNNNLRIKRTNEKENRRGLLRVNIIVILS